MVHPTWSLEEATENSPGRQAGVKDMTKLSAEGAAREAPMVPRLQRSIASQDYPGLTAGPIAFRPFGPYCHMSIHL
jgi:hypothetical protein